MRVAVSSLSQETLNKLYQTDAYISALSLYGNSKSEEVIKYTINDLSHILEFNPISLSGEVGLLINLGLVESMTDFNNRVQKYFNKEEKFQEIQKSYIYW